MKYEVRRLRGKEREIDTILCAGFLCSHQAGAVVIISFIVWCPPLCCPEFPIFLKEPDRTKGGGR